MHEWIVARQVARFRKWTLLGAGLVACAALLLAGCGGASPRPSAPDAAATTPPGQVERPVQSERTASSITVSWRAPASDGEITHYQLRWRAAGEESWTEVPEIANSQNNYEITGLEAGTDYEAQVRAASAAGPGEWSASLIVSTTTTGVLIPDPPSSPATGTVTSNSAVITWSAPETNLTITKYQVQWIEAPGPNTTGRAAAQGGIDWTNAETAETENDTPSITLDGLDPDTTYLVRVRAVTEEIDGHWSEPLEVTTSSGGGTGTDTGVVTGLPAPTGVQGTANGETKIDVTWNAVIAPEGFTLTGYTVEWGVSGTVDRMSASAGTSTSHTITGLSAGTAYAIRVTADGTDSSGTSVSSSSSEKIVDTDGGGIQVKPLLRVYAAYDNLLYGIAPPPLVPKSDGEIYFKIISVLRSDNDAREGVTHDITVKFSGRSSRVTVSSRTASPLVMRKGASTIDVLVKWDPAQEMSSDGWISVQLNPNGDEYDQWGANQYRVTIDHDA